MKEGRTLSALAAEIERQAKSKRDFIAPTSRLRMELTEPEDPKQKPTVALAIPVNDHSDRFGLRNLAHRQIGRRLNIHASYYDRMLEHAPDLLAHNVNHWFKSEPQSRMVRTLDGNVRAFLSDRYRPLDNFDLATAVLPIMQETGFQVASCEVTERRLYLKGLTPRIEGEVQKGDPVQAGICISNSEVGSGALSIQPLIMRLVCLNGMIQADSSLRKRHLGRSKGGNEAGWSFQGWTWELFTDKTRVQSDRALWMQVKDVTRGALSDVSWFERSLEKMKVAAGQRIEGDPVKAIEVVQESFNLTNDERGGVLKHLIEGGDLSQWGVLNAVTRHSQDVDDYDRATTLEAVGGKILELPQSSWQKIATAK